MLRFPVFPGRGAYYSVVVFDHTAVMRAYGLDVSMRESARLGSKKFYARTIIYGRQRNRKVGEILFSIKCCGAGTVSHEMTHAAIGFLGSRRSFNPARNVKDEEALAETVDKLVCQFWRRMYAATDSDSG